MGTSVYDNWERLVDATLKREKLRLLANCPSISSSSTATDTTILSSTSTSTSNGDKFGNSIQLAYSLIRLADNPTSFRTQCLQLKSTAQNLVGVLHQAARARASNQFYESPMSRIVDDMVRVLDKALTLVLKCRGNSLMKRVFIITPTAAFSETLSELHNCIGNVSRLLPIYASSADDYPAFSTIATNDPILSHIWEQIANLYTGSVDERAYAAELLVWLAEEKDRYRKLIIEEGGVRPLLKLVKEGKLEAQEDAARAIGLFGKDPESVQHIIRAGVCLDFAEILNEGPMRVQAVVAWAVSELTAHYPKCQNYFSQHNIITPLVSHLAFETLEEHNQYSASSDNANNGVNNKDREMEDTATKAYLKAMSARALWHLAKWNLHICQSIIETRALLCFAVLLEKGDAEVRYNSAMALMEITVVAETHAELRRSLNLDSPDCKAMVDQLYRVVEMGESELLVPCIKAIGNLARSFEATGVRMIGPLVQLVDETEADVCREACIALTKFACWENDAHLDNCKAIIGAGGTMHLVQLIYLGDENALILLCYIAIHVPDSEELAQADVLAVLKWASIQPYLIQFGDVEKLLPKAMWKLEFL